MKKIPTDLEILNEIYEQYYDDFAAYSKENPQRETKIFVPIDIEEIAESLDVDGDIIFGRLYYHLNKKYGYKNDNGSKVSIYATIQGDGHSVNLPLVASVLADLRKQNKKFKIATSIAVFSLIVSAISMVISILK